MNDAISKWARIILGVFLVIYGLNQWFHFYPTNLTEMSGDTQAFLDAVVIYLPYLYVLEILIGLLLVLNRWTSLILLVLFPLSVSFMIFLFSHPDLVILWQAVMVAALNVYLLVQNREKYLPLLD